MVNKINAFDMLSSSINVLASLYFSSYCKMSYSDILHTAREGIPSLLKKNEYFFNLVPLSEPSVMAPRRWVLITSRPVLVAALVVLERLWLSPLAAPGEGAG